MKLVTPETSQLSSTQRVSPLFQTELSLGTE